VARTMAQTPKLRSDLLDARLRAHHASLLKSRPSSVRHRGRDDNIFDSQNFDEELGSRDTRRASTREHLSTPTSAIPRRISGANARPGPSGTPMFSSQQAQTSSSAWRTSSTTRPGSRRTSGSATYALANNQTPRAMGARELEDHVDKLSKQNFDLKLEIYHRRAKIEDLEKKLAETHSLEEDNMELQGVNEELLAELEKRDRALDEAVLLICNLEDKVAMMEEQVCRSRSRGKEPVTMTSREKTLSTLPDDVSEAPAHTARTEREYTTPERSNRSTRLPSFIQQPKPSVLTLRSLYMQDGRSVRPIPSVATIRSREDKTERDLDEPQSPVFSVLSRSDLGSLYEHGESASQQPSPSNRSKSIRSSDRTSGIMLSDEEIIQDDRNAFVNRWVMTDRATSPPVDLRSPRGHDRSGEDSEYQSLSTILARDEHAQSSSPGQKRKRPHVPGADLMQATPLLSRSTYRPDVFPPTPNTMNTAALHHSRDSPPQQSTSPHASRPSSRSHHSGASTLRSPVLDRSSKYKDYTTPIRNPTLPWEMEAYTDGHAESPDDADMTKQDSAVAVSAPESIAELPAPLTTETHALFVTDAADGEEDVVEHSPARVKIRTGNRRLLVQRGRSFHGDSSSPASTSSRPQMTPRTMTAPVTPREHLEYDDGMGHSREFGNQSAEQDEDDDSTLEAIAPPPQSHYESHSSIQPHTSDPSTNTFDFTGFEHALDAVQIPYTAPSKTLDRASSLRQRVKRFVRRGSTSRNSNLSLPASASSTPSLALPAAEGKSKRFKFQRTSSTRSSVLSLAPSLDAPRPASARPGISSAASYSGRRGEHMPSMSRPPTSRSMSSGVMLSPPVQSGSVSRASIESRQSTNVSRSWHSAGNVRESESSGSVF